MTPLNITARLAAELRARLAEAYQMDADDEAISDTIEGELPFPEQVAAVAREALEAEAYAEALGRLIDGHRKRQARLVARGERLRSLALWALAEAGFKKLACPDMTLSLREGKPPLLVDDVPIEQVPPEFKRVSYSIDKTAVRAALTNGETLDFARLGNAGQTLTIRKS